MVSGDLVGGTIEGRREGGVGWGPVGEGCRWASPLTSAEHQPTSRRRGREALG
jgi:hypothetical protein